MSSRHCVIHITPQTKAKNLATRRKPRPRQDPREAERQRRDDIRAERCRREQEAFMQGRRSPREVLDGP
jgi:hypothetical protein